MDGADRRCGWWRRPPRAWRHVDGLARRGSAAFPRLSRKRLDELLPRCLVAAESTPEASCWSLLPPRPRDLGEALCEAGFRDAWQAHWMAAESCAKRAPLTLEGVEIGIVEQWEPTELPWDGAGITQVRRRLATERPRRVWHLAAWRAHEPVGHATVNVTTGPLGLAGIYDMGVAGDERRRGLGTALTLAALELGRTAGCAIATLNATPEGEVLYRQLGFRFVGLAQTWWR